MHKIIDQPESDVICSLPVSSELKTSQGIPKQIQIILDEVKRVTGEEFDWYESGNWVN